MFERTRQGSVDVVQGNSPLVEEQLADAAAALEPCLSGQPRIVFDLVRVPLIDSCGLEFLLACCERCEARGGGMRLANLSPLVAEILRITGVGDQFEIYGSTAAAAGSFAR